MRKIIFGLCLTTSFAAIAAPMDTKITFSGAITSNGNWQAKYGNDVSVGTNITATIAIDSLFTSPSMLTGVYCFNDNSCSYRSTYADDNPIGSINYHFGSSNLTAELKYSAPDHIDPANISVYNNTQYPYGSTSVVDRLVFYSALENLNGGWFGPISHNNSTFSLIFPSSTFSSANLLDAWNSSKLATGPITGTGTYDGEYGILQFNITNWSVTTVPLPSSFLFMSSSLIALARLRRK